MDKILLEDNKIAEIGLILNDENSIIEDEIKGIPFSKNDKHITNNVKQSQESNPVYNVIKNSKMSDDEAKQGNIRINGALEQPSKCSEKGDTELIKYSSDKDLGSEGEQNKIEDLLPSQNGDKSPKNFYNNKKENDENNVISSKTCTDNKNKKIPSKEIENVGKETLEEYDEDTVCGLEIFNSRCLQPYATANVYVVLYSIMGTLQGCYYTYLTGSLSTLEKRFAFKTKISGTIMSVDEITPVLLGMIVGYYATKIHRPRMVAFGMLLSGMCCFVSTLPYFIYGPVQNMMSEDIRIYTGAEYCDPRIQPESCDPDRPQNLIAVLLFMFGSFLKGFGNLVFYAVGLAYLDDNAEKKNTPIYLAIALALRLLGPLVGFLMSSGFLKYYENPLYDPGFGPEDPRWIGAWWIGFFLQGILLVIFTIPIALFPRRLPGQKVLKAVSTASEDGMKEIFRGLISALKRLGKNPVFVVLILNMTMKVFGHFGHAIMLPKYMENQFKLSASEASLYSGAVSIVCMIISTILGGFLIWKFRPRIKVLLSGMVASEMILAIGFLILMIPRCQTPEMSHFGKDEDGLVLNSVCNNNCDCSTTSFTPFCGPDGKTLYFSPCYAGCTQEINSSRSSKMSKVFSNCSCVIHQQLEATISEGFCPDENCRSQMIIYLILLFVLVTVSNLFTVAGTMILLRCVHPSDKSVALGTFETFICLFGFIPFPVTFGALVDSACLVWEKSCGETGNCWFYDMDKYTYLLHGVSALFSSFCVLCLIALYFLSDRIRNLYEEEDDEEETKYVDIKLDTVSGSVTKL